MTRFQKRLIAAIVIGLAAAYFLPTLLPSFWPLLGGPPPIAQALAAAYIVPSLVAWVREHRNTGAIIILNLLLGWTVLGWIAALIWSATNTGESK